MNILKYSIFISCLYFFSATPAVAALSALWSFEDDGGVYIDLSGNNNHATPAIDQQSPFRLAGEALFGKALIFDGNDYAEVADSQSLSLSDDFSISARVNVTDYGASQRTILLEKGDAQSGGGLRYKLSVKTDGYLNFSMTDSTGTENYSGFNIAENEWNQIGIVRYATTGEVHWYKNGLRAKITTNTITGSLIDSTGALLLGAEKNTGFRGFYGAMDDVHIFDNALTDQEMEDISKPRTQVMMLSMDENTGLTTYDQTIFGNNGNFASGDFSPAWANTDISGDFALAFDGNDFLTIENDPSISSVSEGLSVSVYVYRTLDGNNSILYKTDASGPAAYRLNVKTDGCLNLSIHDGVVSKNFSGFYVAPNVWTKCAVSVDMAAQKVTWFKDDQFNKASFFTGITSIKNSSGPLLLGARNSTGSDGFNGLMDDVEIQNTPILGNSLAQAGQFELTLSDTGHSSPVTTGSISSYPFTIKNLTASNKTYSILVTDNHLLVGKTHTLKTETLAAGEPRQIIFPSMQVLLVHILFQSRS